MDGRDSGQVGTLSKKTTSCLTRITSRDEQKGFAVRGRGNVPGLVVALCVFRNPSNKND